MQKKIRFLPILALLVFLFSPSFIAAQENRPSEKSRFTDKLFFGGGLGLQFGTVTLVDISPVVGYRVTEKFETGLGFTYKYYRYKDYYIDYNTGIGYDLKSNILGGSIFARYHILENIFAHAEFERLRYSYDDFYNSGSVVFSERRTAFINSIFVGGGYRQRITSGSYFFIMALWNLNDSSLSPYTNPVLRMGVVLGM
ncbi:MAG: hypothetical protein FD166_3421 [Bacteroidetes bacterium]|nr:MAG: hypothetical protein FD166_3421 [Bacteroidota bacterium]